MNIGQLSEASGVSAKMIRHYESIGLIPKPPRSDAGYRRYQQTDVQLLSFVRRARSVSPRPRSRASLRCGWIDAARRVKSRHLQRATLRRSRRVSTNSRSSPRRSRIWSSIAMVGTAPSVPSSMPLPTAGRTSRQRTSFTWRHHTVNLRGGVLAADEADPDDSLAHVPRRVFSTVCWSLPT